MQYKVTDQWMEFDFQGVTIPMMSIILKGPTWESDRDEFPKDITITFICGGKKVASIAWQTKMPEHKNFSQRLVWCVPVYCTAVRLHFKNNHGRQDWLGAINRLRFFASKTLCKPDSPDLVEVFYGEPEEDLDFFDINSVDHY